MVTNTALITGASSGIGAVYADRLARRGHDLVLVARDAARLDALATRLRGELGVRVEVAPADLTSPADLARIESRLREDPRIGLLVNNAGAAAKGGFGEADVDAIERVIRLNVMALTRLALAPVARFLEQREGTIINLSSVLALAPEVGMGVYPATKSFVLALSHTMHAELGSRGIYVQAVLPGATRTEIWERSGRDIETIPHLMDVEELVDAALVGFDRRELVTVPPLPDEAQYAAFTEARQAMIPNLRNAHAALRYRSFAAGAEG